VPALASQASLTPHREEGGLALASVGAGRMDMDTPMLAGIEPAPLIWDMVIHTMAWATSHPMGIHIGIHEVDSSTGKVELAEIDCSHGGR